jgi:hypothetical protein
MSATGNYAPSFELNINNISPAVLKLLVTAIISGGHSSLNLFPSKPSHSLNAADR